MAVLIDLTGQIFGRLKVVGRAVNDNGGRARWFCECSCGGRTTVAGFALRSGHTTSCGCWRNLMTRKACMTHGQTVGHRWSTEYAAYRSALQRCTDPNVRNWKDYGGRGIRFRFKSFDEFFTALGKKPSPKLSLDRINNDGHYESGNVRWATRREQVNNQRRRNKAA